MNILYIGPYRSLSIDGYLSLNLLLNLKDLKQYTVTARPIFISNRVNNLASKLNDTILSMENHQSKSFDLLIQNTEINTISYNSKIPYHIFFPNYKDIIPDDSISQKYVFLSNSGLLLYSNNIHKKLLEYLNIDNGLFLNNNINNKLLSPTNNIFNLGIYNRYKKYYTIVDATMEYAIQNLIINFVTKFQNKDYCLVVFLPNTTQNLLDQYQKYIKEIYTIFDINFSINKILIVPIDHNVDALVSAHKTGDIYISLKDNIQTILSSSLGKNIIYYKSEPILSYEKNNLKKYGTIEYKEKLDLDQPSIIKNIDNLKEIIGRYAQ